MDNPNPQVFEEELTFSDSEEEDIVAKTSCNSSFIDLTSICGNATTAAASGRLDFSPEIFYFPLLSPSSTATAAEENAVSATAESTQTLSFFTDRNSASAREAAARGRGSATRRLRDIREQQKQLLMLLQVEAEAAAAVDPLLQLSPVDYDTDGEELQSISLAMERHLARPLPSGPGASSPVAAAAAVQVAAPLMAASFFTGASAGSSSFLDAAPAPTATASALGHTSRQRKAASRLQRAAELTVEAADVEGIEVAANTLFSASTRHRIARVFLRWKLRQERKNTFLAVRDPITARELYGYVRHIQDPEHPYSLEQLQVVSLEQFAIKQAPCIVNSKHSSKIQRGKWSCKSNKSKDPITVSQSASRRQSRELQLLAKKNTAAAAHEAAAILSLSSADALGAPEAVAEDTSNGRRASARKEDEGAVVAAAEGKTGEVLAAELTGIAALVNSADQADSFSSSFSYASSSELSMWLGEGSTSPSDTVIISSEESEEEEEVLQQEPQQPRCGQKGDKCGPIFQGDLSTQLLRSEIAAAGIPVVSFGGAGGASSEGVDAAEASAEEAQKNAVSAVSVDGKRAAVALAVDVETEQADIPRIMFSRAQSSVEDETLESTEKKKHHSLSVLLQSKTGLAAEQSSSNGSNSSRQGSNSSRRSTGSTSNSVRRLKGSSKTPETRSSSSSNGFDSSSISRVGGSNWESESSPCSTEEKGSSRNSIISSRRESVRSCCSVQSGGKRAECSTRSSSTRKSKVLTEFSAPAAERQAFSTETGWKRETERSDEQQHERTATQQPEEPVVGEQQGLKTNSSAAGTYDSGSTDGSASKCSSTAAEFPDSNTKTRRQQLVDVRRDEKELQTDQQQQNNQQTRRAARATARATATERAAAIFLHVINQGKTHEHVTDLAYREGRGKGNIFADVRFKPTIPHCSQATLIGLLIRVKLLRSMPVWLRGDLHIVEKTHVSWNSINKQLNDKERVSAAVENPALLKVINRGLLDTDAWMDVTDLLL